MFGNRVTEKDLRDWFSERGWDGQSARFEELELVAIKRPGWVQVFQFSCSILNERDEKQHLCGYCRDDERSHRFDVVYGATFEDLHETFTEWSSELITTQVHPQHPVTIGLLVVFGVLVLLVLILILSVPARESL